MTLLELILVIVLVCWLAGVVVYPGTAAIHLLIAVFLILLMIRLMQGREPRL